MDLSGKILAVRNKGVQDEREGEEEEEALLMEITLVCISSSVERNDAD